MTEAPDGAPGAQSAQPAQPAESAQPAQPAESAQPAQPAESVQPAPTRRFPHWPMTLALVGVAVSLVVVATGHFRRGSVLLAATVVLAMFLRLFLREDEAGLLIVRSKIVDVVLLAVLGIGLGVLAFVVPPPP